MANLIIDFSAPRETSEAAARLKGSALAEIARCLEERALLIGDFKEIRQDCQQSGADFLQKAESSLNQAAEQIRAANMWLAYFRESCPEVK